MSKLALHISDWLNPDVTYDFIQQTQPAVVKVFADGGLNDTKIREALNQSPATVFVGRMYFPDQGIEHDETQPVDTVFTYNATADAQNAFAQMQPIIEKMRGLVTVWESYNEIPIDTEAELTERERQKARNYNAFTVEMARLMHGAGVKYAAYSFSTGNPVHVELWDLLVDGLRASDYLALHEYIAPNEEWTDFNTTMCNKYRAVYARVPEDARKPVLITECGADFLGMHGYQQKISADRYMQLMRDYDAELMKDPIVVGATIFCYGINDKRWKTYDIGGDFAPRLREYIKQTPTPPITPPEVIPTHEIVTETSTMLALVADILALAQQAVTKLMNGDGNGARQLLKDKIVPWFYATAPQHADNLQEAQAQTTARWFAEESIRQIEAGKNDAARQILTVNVIVWLQSPGPKALGILAVDEVAGAGEPAVELNNGVGPSPLLWIAEAPVPEVVVALNRKPKRATAKKKAAAKPGAAAEPKSPVP